MFVHQRLNACFNRAVNKISESITDSINSSVEASIKALMNEHIITLKPTLKEQQKRIDEQKEKISKQEHLVV